MVSSAVTLKSHSYLNENNQPDLQVHLCLKCHFCPQRKGNKYYIKVLISEKKVTSEETGL